MSDTATGDTIYFDRDLVPYEQQLTGVPEGTPELFYELGDENSLIWDFTSEEFYKVLSALDVGALLMFPTEFHNIVFSFMRMVIYPNEASPPVIGGETLEVMHIRHEESLNTHGGASSNASSVVQVMNTVVSNDIAGASLGSNLITLPEGRYIVLCFLVRQQPGGIQFRLKNMTDGVYVAENHSGRGWTDNNNNFVLPSFGYFEVSGSSKTFYILYSQQYAVATFGLGYRVNLYTKESYSEAMFIRLGDVA